MNTGSWDGAKTARMAALIFRGVYTAMPRERTDDVR